MNALHRNMSCKIRFSLEKSLLSYSWINFQIQTAWFYSCPSNTLIIAFSAFYHLMEKIGTLPMMPQTVSPPSCLRTFQELEWFQSRLRWNGEMRKRKKEQPVNKCLANKGILSCTSPIIHSSAWDFAAHMALCQGIPQQQAIINK